AAYGLKLLVDGALAGDRAVVLGAAALTAGAVAVGLVNGLYYLDFLASVAEKAGAAVDARLMRLMAGVPGLAHHARADYLRPLEFLGERGGWRGCLPNATAGLLRVAVQLGASLALLAGIDPILLLLPLLGVGSFLAGRRANELWIGAWDATAETERRRR